MPLRIERGIVERAGTLWLLPSCALEGGSTVLIIGPWFEAPSASKGERHAQDFLRALGFVAMTAAAKSDLELLEDYAQQSGGGAGGGAGSGSALAPLIKRYIDLVYSAALRQVRDAKLAREVTLAVFYLLIQKAKRTGKAEPLACRLYRMTRFASVHAIKREGRKRRRSETLEPSEPMPPQDLPAWDEISGQLDAGIMGLGEMDRTTLILHYFQHEVLGNVAAALGVPESMARERLFGAVGRLREDLVARDLNVAVADVFSSLASHAAHHAPAGLVDAIVETLSKRSIDVDTKELARKTSRTMKRPSMYSVLYSLALILFSAGLAWAVLRQEEAPHATFIPHTTAPAVEMSTRLRKNGEETYLEYVDSQRYVNSVIGAMSTALRSEGEKIPYDRAMGYSGAAFRFAIAEPDWSVSSAFSIDRADDLMKAVGRTMTIMDKPSEPGNLAKTQAAIVSSIDQTRPVLFLHTEAGLITGYRRNGKQFLYRPYNFDGDRTPLFEWGWASIGVISPKSAGKGPMTRPENIRRSLDLALALSKSPHTKKGVDGQFVVFGLEGWQLWIEQLAEYDRFTEYNPDKYKETMTANAWMLASLVDARSAAASYLRWAGSKTSGAAAGHLNKAADLYESVAHTLEPAKKLAPYPWTIPTVEWTEELRKQQAAILTEALKSEKQALGEVSAALSSPATVPTTQP